MYAVEFEVTLGDRVIEIPAAQWETLAAKAGGERVHVIVLTRAPHVPAAPKRGANLLQAAADGGCASVIDYLLAHSLAVDDPTPLRRDALYSR